MNSILLIDKNSHFAGLKQTLELSGFQVICADNDLEGLEVLLQSTFDLAIIPSRTSAINTRILAEYLDTMACKTILVTVTKKSELEIFQLPEGNLPSFFTRFFIETIQYLHSEQQNQKQMKSPFGHTYERQHAPSPALNG